MSRVATPEDLMDFLVQERCAWIRTRSHTVVFDRDADFEHFRRDRSGEVRRLLRIWWVGSGRARAYLGSLRLCDKGRRTDLQRLFRRIDGLARAAGLAPRGLRQRLARFLRREFGDLRG